VPPQYTIPALAAAIIEYFGSRPAVERVSGA
jgi:hypothetical protein